MKHIKETKRFRDWEDELEKQEYLRSQGLTSLRISPKQRKINYLSSKFGWDKKELGQLKSNQLGKIFYDAIQQTT